MISRETLRFLRSLLNQLSVDAGEPNARDTCAKIFRAQDEVDAELAAQEQDQGEG